MKKSVLVTVIVLVFSLVGIILGNKSFAFENNINDSWNINFNNLKTSIINGSAYVPNDPEIIETNINAFDVLISKKGDYASFTFDVENSGNIDAKLVTINKIEPKCISLELPENTSDEELVCSNLDYKYYYTKTNKEVKIGDVIKAGTKENITIKVGFKNNSISDPTGDVQITLFDSTLVYNKK